IWTARWRSFEAAAAGCGAGAWALPTAKLAPYQTAAIAMTAETARVRVTCIGFLPNGSLAGRSSVATDHQDAPFGHCRQERSRELFRRQNVLVAPDQIRRGPGKALQDLRNLLARERADVDLQLARVPQVGGIALGRHEG